MINCIKSKSFSYSQFKADLENTRKYQHPYFLYRIGISQPIDNIIATGINQRSIQAERSTNDKLQLFKKRLNKGLLGMSEPRNREQRSTSLKFSNKMAGQFILGDQKLKLLKKLNGQSKVLLPQGNHKHRKTVFKYFTELIYPKKQPHVAGQTIKCGKNLSNSESDQNSQTNTKSLMIIKTVKKNKQIVRNKIEQYQQQFHKKKEIPIHHSQYFINRKVKVKIHQSEYHKLKFTSMKAKHQRNKSSDTKKQNSFNETQDLKIFAKGESKLQSNQFFTKRKEELSNLVYNRLKLNEANRNKNKKNTIERKEDWSEIGPWNRKNDYEFSF